MQKTFLQRLFLLCSILLLTACISTTMGSIKDPNYSKKINSVVIWNAGGLSESYSTLIDRMERTSESLRRIFVASNAKATILSTRQLELNKEDKIRAAAGAAGAEHYLRLQVLQTKKSNASIAVEFYVYEVTLVDLKSGKEVWKSTVNANFYSEPEAMAKDLAALLAKDGLL